MNPPAASDEAMLTQDNQVSEHTKAPAADRVYQVVELDVRRTDKNGIDIIYIPTRLHAA
jgi:hypothetical protein